MKRSLPIDDVPCCSTDGVANPSDVNREWKSLVEDTANAPTLDAAMLYCLVNWRCSLLCVPPGAPIGCSSVNADVLSLVERRTVGAPTFITIDGRSMAVRLFDLGAPLPQQWLQQSPLPGIMIKSHTLCVWRGRPLTVGGINMYPQDGLSHSYYRRNNQWSSAPGLQQPRHNHSSVCVGESVVACGGFTHGVLPSMEILGASGRWKYEPSPQAARHEHASSIIGGDSVTATGFVITGGIDPSGTVLSSSWYYDTVSEQWSPVAVMCHPDNYVRAVTLGDGCVYVTGEEGVQCYDSRADSWKMRSPMTTPVYAHAAVRLEDNVLLAFGGWTRTGNSSVDLCQVYDNRSDSWRNEQRWRLPYAMYNHVAVVLN